MRGLTMYRSLTFALALLCLSCCVEVNAARPNFLVIVSDDQRPDTIAALGNSVIKTPTLDQMARNGMAFTRAVAPFPLCVPSRAEILTGISAFGNGVPYDGGKLKPDSVFWGQTLANAGYQTAYCGKWMNDGRPETRGYQSVGGLFSSGGAGAAGREPRYGRKGRLITGYRGWTFKDSDGKANLAKGIGVTGLTSKHIADGAISLLDSMDDRPFFLHVNFAAPHDPLIVPAGYSGRYTAETVPLPKNFRGVHPFDHGNLRGRDERLLPWPRTERDVRDEIAAYYAVIEDMDAQIGRILEALKKIGRDQDTYVLFTSDHGLALGSHGLMGKQNMYEHSVGVPFLVVGPRIRRGVRSAAPIYLRDMFPTTCDLAGIQIPTSLDGISFASELFGDAYEARDAVFGYYNDSQRMIRTTRWKLIHYPEIDHLQLFDLQSDPHELHNLADQQKHEAILSELSRRMNDWFRQQAAR